MAEGGHFVHMAGKEVYKYATRQLAESSQAALREAGLTVGDIDQFLFHQANIRIIESVQNAVGIPADKTYLNIERYGNTSAASVPMALVEAVAEDRIKPGDRLLMVAFGAGYTAGAAVVEWTADPARALPRARGADQRSPAGPAGGRRACGPIGAARVRPDRQDGARHRRQPWPGAGNRDRLRRQGADVAINYRGNAEAADAVTAEITALGRRSTGHPGRHERRSRGVRGDRQGSHRRPRLGRHPRQQRGITRDNLLVRMDADEWDSVIATNLSGPFWMTRAIARPMMKARRGRIINMSSAAGRMGNPGQANYAAAKAGLIGLTKTTARELASRGITCNAIAPGLIETELIADMPPAATEALTAMTPLGYIGSVDDVASAAVYFASDEARYVTGQVLGVDGGIVMGSDGHSGRDGQVHGA